MAAAAVPPTRLPHATRVAVREVLLAELLSAGTRARAMGCPPETLFDILNARLRSAAEGGGRGLAAGDGWSGRNLSDTESRPLAEDSCPGDAGRPGRCARPRSAAEDGQDRRHDPVEPGSVGECGG